MNWPIGYNGQVNYRMLSVTSVILRDHKLPPPVASPADRFLLREVISAVPENICPPPSEKVGPTRSQGVVSIGDWL